MRTKLKNSHRISTSKVLIGGLVFSLLLHFGFLISKVDYSGLKNPYSNIIEPIEIVDIPMNLFPPEKITIVDTEEANNSEIDPDTMFLGNRNQKAEEEMRAQLGTKLQKQEGGGQMGQQASLTVPDGIGLSVPTTPQRDWKTLSFQDLGIGTQATSNDYLKEVKEGKRTILSTKEFQYHSYFRRLKLAIEQHWRPLVSHAVGKLRRKGKVFRPGELTTNLRILLNKSGNLIKVSRVASCGILEIDNTGVNAFRKSAPFPNPPIGIIDEDGLVRLDFSFQFVFVESSFAIKFQRPGEPVSPIY